MIKKLNKNGNLLDKLNEIIKEINRLKELTKTKKYNYHYPKCPKCNSKDIKKGGKRKNLERGDTQRYWCKSCSYHFTPRDNEYRMRVSKGKLESAFRLRHQGFTYSQIAKKLKGISRQTICKWMKKYKIPLKEREVEIEMKNQYGKYKRKFKIKC